MDMKKPQSNRNQRFKTLWDEFKNEVLSENETDADYMSDVNSAIMQGAPKNSHLILWAAVAFLTIGLIWASLATLDEVTSGSGKVIPSSKLQVIQNLEGGILSEIFVKEGQIVEKGEPLMRLDDTRFSSNYRESKLEYLALLAKSARLEAEVNETPFEAPDEVIKLNPAFAESEQAVYNSRKSEIESNINVLKEQEIQKKQEFEEAKAKESQVERSYNLLMKELRMSEPLVAEGAMSEVEVLRLKREANDLRGELETTRLMIPRIESTLDEVRRKMQEVHATFKNKAVGELTETKAELSQLTENIKALEDRVTRTVVRAPLKGTVKQIKISTIGGVVQPGSDIMEIVPLEDSLLVEAKIRPSDIAFLSPGQEAMVKITAYDYAIYGGLKAELEHISADTILDEEDDESYYVIKVRTREDKIEKNGEVLQIIPGMTATVDILTGEKTVLEYLLKPILRAREKAMRER